MFWKKDQSETALFINKVKAHRPFIVYDLETTGKKSDIEFVVQFSANRYEVLAKGVYELVDSIDLYLKPPIVMSQEVIDIHGITNEFLADKPTEQEAFHLIFNFLSKDAVLTGYNIVKFDNKFMEKMYERNGYVFQPTEVVDIYTMAKENIHPRYVKDFSLKLSNIVEYFHISDDIQFHSAAEDIMATWLCGIEMIKHNRKCFGSSWENRPKADILSMSHYKKSSIVNRIYVTLYNSSTGNAKLYYDIPKSGWVDEEGEVIMQTNMPDLEKKAEEIAISRGFVDLKHFDANYKLAK